MNKSLLILVFVILCITGLAEGKARIVKNCDQCKNYEYCYNSNPNNIQCVEYLSDLDLK